MTTTMNVVPETSTSGFVTDIPYEKIDKRPRYKPTCRGCPEYTLKYGCSLPSCKYLIASDESGGLDDGGISWD